MNHDGPGRVKYFPENTIIELIARMFELGLGGQILLGGDTAQRSYWKANGGATGIAYILEQFIPRLRREGFAEQQIEAMLVSNPARRRLCVSLFRRASQKGGRDYAMSTLACILSFLAYRCWNNVRKGCTRGRPAGNFFAAATRSYSYVTPEPAPSGAGSWKIGGRLYAG